ncbi:hypothetical protein PTKIN_Ptkin09bG0045500 [Pterospermum kingtungense]
MDKTQQSSFDREKELKAFDDTKEGVKGLADAGLVKIPAIFVSEQLKLENYSEPKPGFDYCIPTIDLTCVYEDASLHSEIIKKVGDACEKWGFFQVVSHGIPLTTLDDMIDGIRKFHE